MGRDLSSAVLVARLGPWQVLCVFPKVAQWHRGVYPPESLTPWQSGKFTGRLDPESFEVCLMLH